MQFILAITHLTWAQLFEINLKIKTFILSIFQTSKLKKEWRSPLFMMTYSLQKSQNNNLQVIFLHINKHSRYPHSYFYSKQFLHLRYPLAGSMVETPSEESRYPEGSQLEAESTAPSHSTSEEQSGDVQAAEQVEQVAGNTLSSCLP